MSLHMAPDPLDNHIQGHHVMAPLQNHNVGKALGGLHELLVHGLDGGEVLRHHRVQGAAPLLHVPGDAAEDAHIGVGVHENLDVHQIP